MFENSKEKIKDADIDKQFVRTTRDRSRAALFYLNNELMIEKFLFKSKVSQKTLF